MPYPELTDADKNQAKDKRTWQSGVTSNGESRRAVDGNYDAEINRGSCIYTHNVANPWWAVDLERSYEVKKVIVSTRNQASE